MNATDPKGNLGAAIEDLAHRVLVPDEQIRTEVAHALDRKTKPRNSLGRLEDLASTIAAIRRTALPELPIPAIVLAAGDHGITAEGVSAYPAEVTGQMVLSFLGGGAAVNVLAREAGARLVLVDAGILAPIDAPGIRQVRLGSGTQSFVAGPAMTAEQAVAGLVAGSDLAHELADDGVTLIALGEMGIGNTTSAAALLAALVPADPAEVCGLGTGLDDAGLARKIAVVERGLALHAPAPSDSVGALAAVGGFEIAVLAGAILGACARSIPIVLDGLIVGAAAVVAARIEPRVVGSLIAAHRSPEPGHRIALDHLGLEPLLDLQLRLGEGSGAALALPLIRSAVAILRDMATFEEAAVTDTGA